MTRHVMIALVGTTPAVLSLTLYALAHRKSQWIPDEIHVVSTRIGLELLRDPPTEDQNNISTGWVPFQAVLDSMVDGGELNRSPSIHWHGIVAPDVDQREATESLADLLARVYVEQSKLKDTEIHLSAAGGRKSMGWIAAQVFSLLARPQDRASQVLVDSVHEGAGGFYFPTQPLSLTGLRNIKSHSRQTFDIADRQLRCIVDEVDGDAFPFSAATVELVDLPSVRLHSFLEKELINAIHEHAPAQFGKLVRDVDIYLNSRVLELDTTKTPSELRICDTQSGRAVFVLRAGALTKDAMPDTHRVESHMPDAENEPIVFSVQRKAWAWMAWVAWLTAEQQTRDDDMREVDKPKNSREMCALLLVGCLQIDHGLLAEWTTQARAQYLKNATLEDERYFAQTAYGKVWSVLNLSVSRPLEFKDLKSSLAAAFSEISFTQFERVNPLFKFFFDRKLRASVPQYGHFSRVQVFSPPQCTAVR